ncbi:hypothetical protein AGLY_006589 [Aphis glycines]|uniref:Uncharacterized protein n=1 Tax=Aphis glycines TaxID=307491 RepID=A0A6G0TRZ3_APHGL|nr:hypothetical protein AGLY_006589 [Aphis glycines]
MHFYVKETYLSPTTDERSGVVQKVSILKNFDTLALIIIRTKDIIFKKKHQAAHKQNVVKWVPLCCTLGAVWITIILYRSIKLKSNDKYCCIRKTILNRDDVTTYTNNFINYNYKIILKYTAKFQKKLEIINFTSLLTSILYFRQVGTALLYIRRWGGPRTRVDLNTNNFMNFKLQNNLQIFMILTNFCQNLNFKC